MKLRAAWLDDPATSAVSDVFRSAGHQVFFVGGCVRNTLLNAPVTDIDISTDARPTQTIALAKAAGMAAYPTGIDHGTVTIVTGGTPFEVTTFRKDVATDGRRAVVAFADTLEEDAQRRDFTMNALYSDPEGVIQDPTGGLQDLTERRFRFIGDAHQRIREDYLRILRFFRFHAWYGRDLDADGLAACAELAEGLAQLSTERVTAESLKLLGAPDPAPAVASMEAAGVLARVLPGADAKALTRTVHFQADIDAPQDAIVRLASLTASGADQLRLSNVQKRQYQELRDGMASQQSPSALGQVLGYPMARDILILRAAMFEMPPVRSDFEAAEFASQQTFPVRAGDLPDSLKGAAIGEALTRLKAEWIASGFTLTRQDLLSGL
ncbi:CCA tRNA nucleotidyltransferase [Shimia ponticola]|uniref:CCA tRNA nucleotidyltransferase n=1 Tax=Shimia ponticola TaxID=2582893 RepID=UPI0011BE0A42|nr:CCA tRNA nucleotidyltransferase [Shimia ponticola]